MFEKAGMAEGSPDGFLCIHCGQRASHLYTKYSNDVIRLAHCKECENIVDKYVEYEAVVVVIDLVLQYTPAYRHAIYNRSSSSQPRLRLALFLVFCMSFDRWIERSIVRHHDIFDLEFDFYECLLLSMMEMSIFIGCVCLASRLEYGSFSLAGLVANACVVGYYGKIAVVFSIVYGLQDEMLYRIAICLLTLLSQFQVIRVTLPSLSLTASGLVLLSSTLLSCFVPRVFSFYFMPSSFSANYFCFFSCPSN